MKRIHGCREDSEGEVVGRVAGTTSHRHTMVYDRSMDTCKTEEYGG